MNRKWTAAEFRDTYNVKKFGNVFKHTPKDEEALEADILQTGTIRDPLVVWKGGNALIDGFTRLDIATKHPELKFDVVERDFEDDIDAQKWMLQNQGSRRNLSKVQLAIAALDYMVLLKKEAEKRKKAGKEQEGEPIHSRTIAAKLFRVGEGTIEQVEYIQEHDPDLIDEIHGGRESINSAHEKAKEKVEGKKTLETPETTVKKVAAKVENLIESIEVLTSSIVTKKPKKEDIAEAERNVARLAKATEDAKTWLDKCITEQPNAAKAKKIKETKAKLAAETDDKKKATLQKSLDKLMGIVTPKPPKSPKGTKPEQRARRGKGGKGKK